MNKAQSPQTLLLFILLIGIAFSDLHAQSPHRLSKKASVDLESYQVLPDQNYSFHQILNDTTLKYSIDSLKVKDHKSYWVKVRIENPYPDDESYVVHLSLPFHYRLYFFDHTKAKWLSKSAGLSVANDYRQNGRLLVVFPKQAYSVLYFKISLHDVQQDQYAYKPRIILEKAEALHSREELLSYKLWVSCIVLLSFIGYNFYLYIYLRDKAYLYVMIVQIGAIIFLFGARQYFNLAFPLRIYNVRFVSETRGFFYDINNLAQHVGIFITMWGITQFTREYLNTRERLPRCDQFLRYLIYGYAVMEAVPSLITISGIFQLDYYTNLYDNLYIQFLLLVVIIVGVIAQRHQISTAKYFLLANIVPIVLVIAASIYSITQLTTNSFLPELAIFSQILTFGVALIARVKVVTEELNQKQLEAVRLEAQIEISAYQHLIMEKENDQLTGKLESNQRELVGSQIYIHQKSVLLSELAKQVQDIKLLHPQLKPEGLKHIQSSLRDDEYLHAQWDNFKLHFEQVHPQFFANLKSEHPQLTANDLRLCAYLHINLSTKEIASLLHIAPTSVKQAKSRLNKKMGGQLPKN